LRSKLRKSEQELDEVKASNISYKDEKERLKKKVREVFSVLKCVILYV